MARVQAQAEPRIAAERLAAATGGWADLVSEALVVPAAEGSADAFLVRRQEEQTIDLQGPTRVLDYVSERTAASLGLSVDRILGHEWTAALPFLGPWPLEGLLDAGGGAIDAEAYVAGTAALLGDAVRYVIAGTVIIVLGLIIERLIIRPMIGEPLFLRGTHEQTCQAIASSLPSTVRQRTQSNFEPTHLPSHVRSVPTEVTAASGIRVSR